LGLGEGRGVVRVMIRDTAMCAAGQTPQYTAQALQPPPPPCPPTHLGLAHLVVRALEEVGGHVGADQEGDALVGDRHREHLPQVAVALLHELPGALFQLDGGRRAAVWVWADGQLRWMPRVGFETAGGVEHV